MSGGVDSSVTAALLQEAGYDCTGVTMKLIDEVDSEQPGFGVRQAAGQRSCCGLDDVEDAKRVCTTLGMRHYTVNYANLFEDTVIRRFVDTYSSGATPNPCIDCNRYLKFDRLLNWAKQMNFDCMATGHYARIVFDEMSGRWRLLRATDIRKDQSYVLYSLTQEQLAFLRLPLGDYSKQQVREYAAGLGLSTAQKPESQDICFVADGDYAGFIRRELVRRDLPAPRPGAIIGPDSQVVGRHKGVINYTIGQRRGLNVAGGQPLYVRSIDAATSTICLADKEHMAFYGAFITDVNLIGGTMPDGGTLDDADSCLFQHSGDVPETCAGDRHASHGYDVDVAYRYQGSLVPARAFQLSEKCIKIVFARPQPSLSKGQALVMYDSCSVLGGGTIEETF
jgi:tRNA-specific 2-thiouridylase